MGIGLATAGLDVGYQDDDARVSVLTFTQNQNIELKVPCTLNGFPCSTSGQCNLTIQYPNSSYLVDNLDMTNGNNGDFNYSIIFDERGKYQTKVNCQDDGQNDTSTFIITITPTGEEFSSARGILYIIILFVLLFVFSLTTYGFIKIPWKHSRGDDGRIVSVNDLKPLKILFFAFSYILLMFILGIARAVTFNYLDLYNVANFFQIFYWLMFSMAFPIGVCALVIGFVSYLNNLKLNKLLERNVKLR